MSEKVNSHGRRIPQPDPANFLAPLGEGSTVHKVIGVVSGKGGVGKSLVTSLLACQMRRRGFRTAILDADVTGPSIPASFGLDGMLTALGDMMIPAESATGIKIVSANLILEDKTEPVIWRGPMVAGVIKQFWSETLWNEVDYMFVDMPPGTGDVPLTVFQSLPVDGIVVVTSPQDLVSMIVAKAVNMAKKMNVPILGLVENMSYMVCPHCGEHLSVFGESHLEETAASYGIPVLARIPIDSSVARRIDAGQAEAVESPFLDEAAERLEHMIK